MVSDSWDFSSIAVLSKIMYSSTSLPPAHPMASSLHFTTTERTMVSSVGAASSSSRYPAEQSRTLSPENGNIDGRDKSSKKKLFNLNLNRSDKRA
jgi:hypothetical protein